MPRPVWSKPSTRAERWATCAARACNAVALLCVVAWSVGANTPVDKTLGGLEASLVFNWHPVLMVFAFVFCLGEGALASASGADVVSRGVVAAASSPSRRSRGVAATCRGTSTLS